MTLSAPSLQTSANSPKAPATAKVIQYRYIVTLTHPSKEDVSLDLTVASPSPAALYNAVNQAKQQQNLKGYSIFETMECDCPF